jgi:uncharacterized delta-60 repeat protein
VKNITGSFVVILSVTFFLLLTVPYLSLAAYIKDPAFGDGGVQLVEIDNMHDRVFAAASLENGKIVVAGTSENSATTDIAVVRLNSDGSLDTSFNIDGKAVFVQGGDDGANDVVVKEDGTILVAGFTREDSDAPKKFVLLQITSTGNLDFGFGPTSSGIVTLEVGESGGEAFALTLDAENRIVSGGMIFSDTQKWAVVARYLEDGSLDTTFGTDGFRRIEVEGDTAARYIGLQSDGKIILGGLRENEDGKRAVLFRLNGDGSMDNTYGTDGAAYLDGLLDDSEFNAAVILEDDSVVAAGYTTAHDRKSITTAKFTSAGRLNTSYGINGLTVNDLGDDGVAYDIAAQDDGGLLVAGEGGNGTNNDIVLIDLDSSGAVQSSTVLTVPREAGNGDESDTVSAPQGNSTEFDSQDEELVVVQQKGAPLLTDIRGEDDSGRAVLLTDDGRVLVAGFAGDGIYDDMVVVSFTSDTDPDTPGVTTNPRDIPYYIGTLSVTNVTRNSAMSGGVITENDLYVCEESESSSEEDCRPTVVARGVAYGVVSYPSYRVPGDSPSAGDGGAATEEDGSVFPAWVKNSAHNSTVVRSGQTEDGSEAGTFGSDITGITPEVVYYVRAYAVLSDDRVIYGNQKTFKTDDACFIATAAYGSALQSHIDVLRLFRDKYLKNTSTGKQFVGFYYKWSPGIAEFIERSPLLQTAVRIILFPFVVFSYFMVSFSLQIKVLLLLLLGCSWYSCHFFLSRR